MDLAASLDVLMFLCVIAALLSGYPVALTLAGISIAFAVIGHQLGVFPASFFAAAPSRIYGVMTNQTLVAVPLFVVMGVMLEKSKLAEELLDTMGRLMGRMRGGLGISVIAVGGLLAASTGIVGATVVTMGLLSLPTMLRRGYDPALASGAIAASGTLGQIIPPSIVLVLLGDVMGNAYQRAQLDQGVFSPDTVSVGDLFAGALIPGLALVAAYALYMAITALLRPNAAPAAREADDAPVGFVEALQALAPPLALIIAVLGSILGGLATPVEAAAFGAVGATFLAGLRRTADAIAPAWSRGVVFAGVGAVALLAALASTVDLSFARGDVSVGGRVAQVLAVALAVVGAAGLATALARVYRARMLEPVLRDAGRITAMVFLILLGATIFSLVFRGLGGDELVEHLLSGASGALLSLASAVTGAGGLADNMQAQATAGVIVVMLVMFVLGFFLDFLEIVFVVVPLVAPPLLALGVDPVWLGVMMAINLQTSFLTPPFGFALFYLRGVAPPQVRTMQIYRGAAPFVGIQIGALLLVAALPWLATALPNALGG